MGVNSVRSEAAKAFVRKERILSEAISILGEASINARSLDLGTMDVCGDLAHDLLPYAPGYSGKLLLIISRLFWAMADIDQEEESKHDIVSLERIQSKISQLGIVL